MRYDSLAAPLSELDSPPSQKSVLSVMVLAAASTLVWGALIALVA
ncbi:hypothetical protein [Sphingomonas yabuuchiae]|jgi:hypothetical protein|nr:hypothetical protein [Sphingomonas yabuuchiae]